MTCRPGTHELKLWTDRGARFQPRDRLGRFVRVQHSPERRKILAKAAQMRAELGLPDDPRLQVRGDE